jgi:hypothetical protein
MRGSFGRLWPNLCDQLPDTDAERVGQRTELAQADVLAAGFDVGDRRAADLHAPRELTLGEATGRAQRTNALADVALNDCGKLAHDVTRSSIPTL